MNCPYCQAEMKLGYLHNGRQPIEWVPKDHKATGWADQLSGHGIPFQNNKSFWSGYRAPAFYCPTCRIVIARTTDR